MAGWAVLFPGQGAQTVGMARRFHDEVPAARACFDRAAEVLGYDLAEVCFHGPKERLDSTVVSQPAIFVSSMAAWEWLKAQDHPCTRDVSLGAGLSLGEYTALTVAGVFTFESALEVVKVRGEAMQAASDARPSGMVSVIGLEDGQVLDLCESVREEGEVLQLANWLAPKIFVVSGDRAACARFEEAAQAAGAMRVRRLDVAGAFHTPLMEPAVEPLRAALRSVDVGTPAFPVISNVEARFHAADPEEIRERLVRQVCERVEWEATIRRMLESEITQFYEICPGTALRGLVRRIDRRVVAESTPD